MQWLDRPVYLMPCLLFLPLLTFPLQAEKPAAALQAPSRFFYNDDGDRPWLYHGPFHLQQFHDAVDVLEGTPVTTLCYCANIGSDQAYYPSKVASAHDWRKTPSHEQGAFQRLYRLGTWMRENKVDVLGEVMRRAKARGLEFMPSLRMNDAHFAQKVDPREHPLTGEFWMKNQNLTIFPGRVWQRGSGLDHVLDFKHAKVRAYRMAQIDELIHGYAEDGLELDFTRHYRLFAPGNEQPELVTEMVRQARARLRQREKHSGKRVLLIVRVAYTLARCKAQGCDVATWMREGLVDYVVPSSPDRHFSFDIPIQEFLAAAKGSSCRVVASPDSYKATPAMYRGGMANYFALGQQDTYLFNFFTARSEQREYYPFRDEDYALLRDLKNARTLRGQPKHFVASGLSPSGNLKLTQAGKEYTVTLLVGEDLVRCQWEGILKSARLRLLLAGGNKGDAVQVQLNGQSLSGTTTEGPVLHFDLQKILPRVGQNTVTIGVKKFGGVARPALTHIDLQTDYDLLGAGEK